MKIRNGYSILAIILVLVSCQKEEDIKGFVSFTETSIEVSESELEEIQISVGVNRINHDGGTVNISVEGGTYGEDYTTSFGSEEVDLDIPAASISQMISLLPFDNEVEEENRVLTVLMNEATGDLQIGSRRRIDITIIDDDAPVLSTVDFVSDTLFVEENSTSNVIVTLMLDLPPKEQGTVVLQIEGDAVQGVDFEMEGLENGSLQQSINSGSTQSRFTFSVIDNQEMNDDKEIKISMESVSEFLEIGEQSELVIVIRDDE